MLKHFIFGMTLLLLGCNNSKNSNSSNTDPKQQAQDLFPVKELVIDNGEEEGWGADIRLSIVSIVETDSTKEYKAISTHGGKDLGLTVSVPKAKEGNKGFANGMTIKSIGTESDCLLLTLSKLYKQKVDTSIKFVLNTSVTYVNLKEFAKNLGAKDGGNYTTSNEYKLFFEGKNDEDYAELYVNINSNEHWLELREKDEEYRSAVINFLKQ